jgi:hypothetical protein
MKRCRPGHRDDFRAGRKFYQQSLLFGRLEEGVVKWNRQGWRINTKTDVDGEVKSKSTSVFYKAGDDKITTAIFELSSTVRRMGMVVLGILSLFQIVACCRD